MLTRREFPKSVKLAAWDRCNGFYECGCDMPIVGTPHYDHDLPDDLGGDNSLENCRVLDPKCHRRKTVNEDRPRIDKARRLREKAAGVRPKKRGISYRRFNGDPVWK